MGMKQLKLFTHKWQHVYFLFNPFICVDVVCAARTIKYVLNYIFQLQHANVFCVTSAKGLFCHPYIKIYGCVFFFFFWGTV